MSGEALMMEETDKSVLWLAALQKQLGTVGQYATLGVVHLVGLLLVVFVKSEHQPHVRHVRQCIVRCGTAGMGNKGGVGLRFTLYCRRFLFLNVHYAPHTEALERRNAHHQQVLRDCRSATGEGGGGLWCSVLAMVLYPTPPLDPPPPPLDPPPPHNTPFKLRKNQETC